MTEIIHAKCKNPVMFDSFGNWKCNFCGITKKYAMGDNELEAKDTDILNCIYCNQRLTGKKKKFCSIKCNQNWQYHFNPKARERVKKNTAKSYERIRNTPEYKAKRKIYFSNWYARKKHENPNKEPN
jgi:hypothetical protein